jgi:hypothetical protein
MLEYTSKQAMNRLLKKSFNYPFMITFPSRLVVHFSADEPTPLNNMKLHQAKAGIFINKLVSRTVSSSHTVTYRTAAIFMQFNIPGTFLLK